MNKNNLLYISLLIILKDNNYSLEIGIKRYKKLVLCNSKN